MRNCGTCGERLGPGRYHRHALGTWEVFDPRDGRPVAIARSATAARKLARASKRLDFARAGEGWT